MACLLPLKSQYLLMAPQVFSTSKRRISTVAHNWFVKNPANVAIDTLETVLWKAHDWHYSPSLEW
jgi:hypothetical protein